VFKATKGGQESRKFGITTEGKVHTWIHAPYDKAFHNEIERVTKDLKDMFLGRAYDRSATGMLKDDVLRIGAVGKYLKVAPGDKGLDLEIIKLKDIYKDFKFPN
jgi:hypothetical protein